MQKIFVLALSVLLLGAYPAQISPFRDDHPAADLYPSEDDGGSSEEPAPEIHRPMPAEDSGDDDAEEGDGSTELVYNWPIFYQG